VPEYWRDRLVKLKACGLNTVETYVPWNAHEPEAGKFLFDGMLNIERFIQLAAELDLLVIVRPSPYICAEWDFGGLPAWLLRDPGMRLRCAYQPYLDAIASYYDVLIPRLAALQCDRGGPIIAMQIENEYGSYGNDKEYLRYLEAALREREIVVPLFTSDGYPDSMLQGGTLPHILKTVNFGSNSELAFRQLKQYQQAGPAMCMEFWDGWFDHWEEVHRTRDAKDAADCLDAILAVGASVNIYMFHGGTNFGLTAGANHDGTYKPIATNYDYDAPLNESGDLTDKYFAFRDVIGNYRKLPDIPLPPPLPKAAYGSIKINGQARLFELLENISTHHSLTNPEPMEVLGQSSGVILYRTRVSGPRDSSPLNLQDVHDRAIVYVDGEFKGIVYRNDEANSGIQISVPPQGAQLDILVENMGRVNYGPKLTERKGITHGVRLGLQFLFGWDVYCLPLELLDSLSYSAICTTSQPAFYRADVEIDEPADTYLKLTEFEKGVCYVNGFCLGRYWNVEPHRNLYVPAPLLRKGTNEFIVFELHGIHKADLHIELVASPDALASSRYIA